MKNYGHKFNSIFLIIFSFLFFIFNLYLSDASAFIIPEKFEFDLTWTGIKAGTATLEITSSANEIKIVSTARSAKWVSVFYEVNDRIESILTKKTSYIFIGQPANYKLKLKEGRHKRDKEFIFRAGAVTYIDHLKNEREEFEVPSVIFDTLSSFFYFRTLKFEVGKSVFIKVFDNKKVWDVEVQILRKEKVTIPSGTYDTVLIKPLMKSEGIFYRKGDIYIWLTDDAKRIPVKLASKVAVGHITATLMKGIY